MVCDDIRCRPNLARMGDPPKRLKYGPNDEHPTGIAVLEATLGTVELTWYISDFTVIGTKAHGLPRLNVRFGESSHSHGAALPSVIEQLLAESTP